MTNDASTVERVAPRTLCLAECASRWWIARQFGRATKRARSAAFHLARQRGGGIFPIMNRILFRLLPCFAILLTAGCSTSSYNKRFAEAAAKAAKAGHFEGAYSGKWTSSRAGGGNLRCILTAVNASDYLADFHATWHGFASEHTVPLHTKPAHKKSGARDFEGTSELHTIIGAGTYSCKGTMDQRTMRASYDATYDRGTFQLSRAAAKLESR